MNLSQICIDPQLRNGWQAIDLGVLLARRWYRALFLSWFIPSATVFVLLTLIFFQYNWLAVLVVWWLKPLWDRLPLAIASRALFSEQVTVRSTLRHCFSTFKRDWFPWLTWRRLNPTRSFDMPVTLLEGLQGPIRSKRLTVLHQAASNAALWLTLVGLSIELVVVYSLVLTIMVMVPSEFAINVGDLDFQQSFTYLSLLLSILFFLAMSLVAPFYVACGFTIYISRRVELEGWDIEIRFRHLMEQVSRREQGIGADQLPHNKPPRNAGRGGAKVALLALMAPMIFVLFTTLGGREAHAQNTTPQEETYQEDLGQEDLDREEEATAPEPEFVREYYQRLETTPEAQQAKSDIIDVLSGEDFHRTRVEEGWRKIEEEEEAPADDAASSEFFDNLFDFLGPVRSLFTGAAGLFEILVWLLIIGVIAYLIYRYRDLFAAMAGYAQRQNKSEEDKPKVMFGLDVRKESLPDNIPQQVLKLWREGKARDAIGLLYRATLSRLIHQFSFEFYDGFTEQECVRAVRAGNNLPVTDYVTQLTRVWQYLAYGHQKPQSQDVVALCERWPRLFDEKLLDEKLFDDKGVIAIPAATDTTLSLGSQRQTQAGTQRNGDKGVGGT